MQPLHLKNDTFLLHACLSHPLALASDCKSEIKMGKRLMKYRACACPAEQSAAACIKTSTRPQLQKRKKEIQSRAMRNRPLNRLDDPPHSRSAAFWIFFGFYTVFQYGFVWAFTPLYKKSTDFTASVTWNLGRSFVILISFRQFSYHLNITQRKSRVKRRK